MKAILTTLAAWLLVFPSLSLAERPAAAINVYVIAPSLSTTRTAHDVVKRLHFVEVEPRQAELFLVVVRSFLQNPLAPSYTDLGALRHDADSQLNISGALAHIYLFRLENDLGFTQVSHTSFEAED